MDIALKHVHRISYKHGKSFRYFFERRGYPRKRLHGEPGSAQFMADYAAALKEPPLKAKPVTGTAEPGSLAALVDEYMASARFTKELKKSTQRETTYVLNKIRETNGAMLVRDITPGQCERWMDGFGEKTGAANKWLRIFRILMKWGKKWEYRKDNPAVDVDLFKSKAYRAWEDVWQTNYCKVHQRGTRARLAYELLKGTGQRKSDVADMLWDQIATNSVKVRPHKTEDTTDVFLDIPLHPDLADELKHHTRRPGKTILMTEEGGPLSLGHFGSLVADAIDEAGLPEEAVLHGLRKTATKELIEAGCTPHQAGAVTGHTTIAMIQHYSRDADQKKLAKQAMKKMKRAQTKKAANTA